MFLEHKSRLIKNLKYDTLIMKRKKGRTMSNEIFTVDDNNNAAVRTVSVTGISESNKPDIFTTDENGNAAVRVVGGGGGGSVDTSKFLNVDTLPVASADVAGKFYLYNGITNSSYTHGYIYECQATPVYDSTVEFNPASISSTVAACSGSDFAALVAQYGSGDIDTIIKGTLTYDESGELLVFVGQDDTDATVCTFQLYEQDYVDAGFTFTGILQDGDVITFSCTIQETGATYAWARINVQSQPTPAEIGAATQKQRTVSLMAADWVNSTQVKTVNGVTPNSTVIVAPAPASSADYSDAGILCTLQSLNGLTFTCETTPTNNVSVNVIIID